MTDYDVCFLQQRLHLSKGQAFNDAQALPAMACGGNNACLTGLQDNQKISFELQAGRDGRETASDLKLL